MAAPAAGDVVRNGRSAGPLLKPCRCRVALTTRSTSPSRSTSMPRLTWITTSPTASRSATLPPHPMRRSPARSSAPSRHLPTLSFRAVAHRADCDASRGEMPPAAPPRQAQRSLQRSRPSLPPTSAADAAFCSMPRRAGNLVRPSANYLAHEPSRPPKSAASPVGNGWGRRTAYNDPACCGRYKPQRALFATSTAAAANGRHTETARSCNIIERSC
jgi:hypothetical protein